MVETKLEKAKKLILYRNFEEAHEILNTINPEKFDNLDRILFLSLSGITETIFGDSELGETKVGISRGLAKQSQNYELIGWADLSMGLILCIQGKENDALIFYELARYSFEKVEHYLLLADTWIDIAEILVNQGDLKGGKLCIEEANNYLDKIDEDFRFFLKVRIKLLQSQLLSESGSIERAKQLLLETIEMLNKLVSKPLLFEAFSKIGSSYIKLGENEKALEYLEKALEIRVSKAYDINYAWALLKIITLLITKLKRRESAQPYLQELDLLANETSYQVIKGINYQAKAIYQLGQLNLYNAEINFKEAIKYYKNSSKIHYLYSLLSLAEIYISKFLIFYHDNDFNMAINTLNEVLEIIGDHPLFELKINTLIAKSKLLLVKGEIQEAKKLVIEGLEIAQENKLDLLTALCKKELEKISDPLESHEMRIDQALEYVREIARNWQE